MSLINRNLFSSFKIKGYLNAPKLPLNYPIAMGFPTIGIGLNNFQIQTHGYAYNRFALLESSIFQNPVSGDVLLKYLRLILLPLQQHI